MHSKLQGRATPADSGNVASPLTILQQKTAYSDIRTSLVLPQPRAAHSSTRVAGAVSIHMRHDCHTAVHIRPHTLTAIQTAINTHDVGWGAAKPIAQSFAMHVSITHLQYVGLLQDVFALLEWVPTTGQG